MTDGVFKIRLQAPVIQSPQAAQRPMQRAMGGPGGMAGGMIDGILGGPGGVQVGGGDSSGLNAPPEAARQAQNSNGNGNGNGTANSGQLRAQILPDPRADGGLPGEPDPRI